MNSFCLISVITLIRLTVIYSEWHSADKLQWYLQPLFIGVDKSIKTPADLEHFADLQLCARDCSNARPRLCYYKFQVEEYRTLNEKCGRCPFVKEHCFGKGCISADGIFRTLLTVNRMLPGTAMHVCQGDRIVADVENLTPGLAISFHWHGVSMVKSQWMDGVGHLTQCYISPGQKFRYEFHVEKAGTFYYHASSHAHKMKGLAGPLIVRSTRQEHTPAVADHYTHTIFIQDLVSEKLVYKLSEEDKSSKTISYIINGFGQVEVPRMHKTIKSLRTQKTATPLAEFLVTQEKYYRIRIVAATNLPCSIRITIENHPMKIIALDGNLIDHVKVGTIHMHAGERVDVIVETDQRGGAHWIRVQGNDFCSEAYQSAILMYENTKDAKTSMSGNSDKLFKQFKELPDFNNSELGCDNEAKNLCLKHISPMSAIPSEYFDDESMKQISINVDQTIGMHNGNDNECPKQIFNDIALELPAFPLLTQRQEIPKDVNCGDVTTNSFKKCYYSIPVKLNTLVEFTITNYYQKKLYDMPIQDDTSGLSIHIHGYDILVVHQKADLINTLTDEDENSHPIFKDTINLPKKGSIRVKFLAKNPGYWAVETQTADFNDEGIALVFKVGDDDDIQQIDIPSVLPKCDNYLPLVTIDPQEDNKF